jgi:hypothetical protein
MKNNNTLQLEQPLDLMKRKGEWFQKVLKNSTMKSYIKEARRVKYIVKKDDLELQVNDDETGDIVMNGICLNAAFWLCIFSKKYWVDNYVE